MYMRHSISKTRNITKCSCRMSNIWIIIYQYYHISILNQYEGNLCRKVLGSSISSSTGRYPRIPRRSPTCRLRTGRTRRAWRMIWPVRMSNTFGKKQDTLLNLYSRNILWTQMQESRTILTCARKSSPLVMLTTKFGIIDLMYLHLIKKFSVSSYFCLPREHIKPTVIIHF